MTVMLYQIYFNIYEPSLTTVKFQLKKNNCQFLMDIMWYRLFYCLLKEKLLLGAGILFSEIKFINFLKYGIYLDFPFGWVFKSRKVSLFGD